MPNKTNIMLTETFTILPMVFICRLSILYIYSSIGISTVEEGYSCIPHYIDTISVIVGVTQIDVIFVVTNRRHDKDNDFH